MPTVDKDIAERQIAHCRTLTRPKMFCIVKYVNTLSGKDDFSLCYNERNYRGLFESPAVSEVEILWASKRSGLTVTPPKTDYASLDIDPEIEDEMMFAVAEEERERFAKPPRTQPGKKTHRAKRRTRRKPA